MVAAEVAHFAFNAAFLVAFARRAKLGLIRPVRTEGNDANRLIPLIPGTAAGTVRRRHFTVASATSSTESCLAQLSPGRTMLGFSSMPSSIIPCA